MTASSPFHLRPPSPQDISSSSEHSSNYSSNNPYYQTFPTNNIYSQSQQYPIYYHEFVHASHLQHPVAPGENQEPSALWLLTQHSVECELKRIALGLIERQRRTDDPGMSPFLFVVLPKTSRGLFSALPPSQSTTASAPAAATAAASTVGSEEEVDYWLYFLCDFITPESKTPMLHVCSPPLPPATAPNPHVYMYNEYGSFYQQDYIHHHSYYYNHHPNLHYPTTTTATTITYPGGYRLKDMEKFVEIHAYPMLSLLYLAYLTNTDPEWTDRIKGGIRFLAERCREDLKEIYQSSADMNTPTLSLSPLSSTGIDPNRGHDEMDFDMDQDMEDEYEDEEEEDGQNGDEEEENKMMRLTEEDFWDPFVAAGKGSSVGGIDFQSLDLNRHHKSDPNDSTTQSSGSEGEGENLSEGGEDGLVLGADVLRQVNHPSIEGGILWLCETHHEMYCKGMAAEKLRLFIKRQGGLCNPMEKSVDIQFQRREDAREFYQMLKEYRCVIKLKIRLGWLGGATEEDLLELCTTVRSATIRDLTIDCGGAGEGNNKLSFRPMMNVICQMGFMALAVENFDGVFLSPDDILVTQSTAYRKNSWNVDSTGNHGARFRQQEIYSTLNLPVFPDNIQLKKLAFRYWAQVPDKTAIMNLIGILPNLSELEMMTDSVETLCASIQDKLQSLAQEAGDFQSYNSGSQGHHYHLSHLNLIEARPFGSKAEFTLSKPLGPNHTTRIQGSTWTTNQRPGRLLQTEIGLESLEFTQCLELWEQYTELQQIIARNHSTLRRVKMVCRTERMVDMWEFLRKEFMHPTALVSPILGGRDGREDGWKSGRNVGIWYSSSAESQNQRALGEYDHTKSDSSPSFHYLPQKQRYRAPVHLILYDQAGHLLESSDVEKSYQTVLELCQYDRASYFQPLELQGQIASRLRLSQEFVDLFQLDQLCEDVQIISERAHQARRMFCQNALVICLARISDSKYMERLNRLICLMPIKTLTLQMYSDGHSNRDQSSSCPQRRRKGKGRGDQKEIPGRLLEAYLRLSIDVGQHWSKYFERKMQELLVQKVFPIRQGEPLPSDCPVQGVLVFEAVESMGWWSEASHGGMRKLGGQGGASKKVVYSLTLHFHGSVESQ